jgi:opacity protein-like surface antigen
MKFPQHGPFRLFQNLLLTLEILPILAAAIAWGDDSLTGSQVSDGRKKAPAVMKDDSEWKKPDWLTELSIAFREMYDSNVYYCNVPPLGNQDSMVSIISPKFDINFVPLLGIQDDGFEKVTLSYNPVINYYHAETGENYTTHNIGNLIKGKIDDFSYDLNSLLIVTDGNTVSLPYPNGFNAFVSAPVIRNRRAHVSELGKLTLRYDLNRDWFVRTTAQTVYQDFGIRMMAQVPGYLNFLDRFDVNVGPDIGYNVTRDFAVTLGYRAGHQGQSMFGNNQGAGATGGSANNNYQRALVGLDGKPWPWLKMDVSAGPDFRHYGNDIPSSEDRNFNRIYSDSKLSFLVTKDDTISLLIKQWQWLSSTSVTTLEDECYRIGYKRQWTREFSSEVFAQYADYNYDTYLNRDDNITTFGTTLTYQFNKHVTVDLAYSLDRGGTAYIPGATQPVGRDLTRHLASLGIKYSF